MSDWTPHADAVVRAVPEDEAIRAVRDKLLEDLVSEHIACVQLKEINDRMAADRERLIAERDAARQDRDEWKALHGRAVHEMQARLDRQERENAVLRRAYEHTCEQRDKYQRRTAEWRQSAMEGTAHIVACTGCANGCEGCTDA